ncbi:transposase [Cohnella sp. NL03-T5]|nr:transposase [Cohnella silvisoli]
MLVMVTAKIKIKPTQAQAEALLETVFAYRKGCNLVSSVVFTTRQLKQPALHQITYNTLRSTIGLRSQMAQSAMKTVIARYKTNQSNGHDWTQVQFKQPEYDLVWNRDYSLSSGLFSVNTLQGRIKVPFERKVMEVYFDGSWMFGTAKLVRKHHKWFLHIPMSKQMTEPQLEEMTQIVGIDLGINFLATTYDKQGKTIFFPGRAIKRKRAKYKQMRQQLQKKQTPSARRKLKQIGQRETRWYAKQVC